jgi:hypothetical protein
MKKSSSRILELSLLSAAVVFGAFTLSRFRTETEYENRVPVGTESVERTVQVHEPSGSFGSAALARTDDTAVRNDPEPVLDPASVAALFGWKPPVVPAAPPEPEPEPEEEPEPEPAAPEPSPPVPADWLSFVGKVTDEGGGDRLFFKNIRTGRLERASEDGTLEWRLMERAGGTAVLERDGERYTAEVK